MFRGLAPVLLLIVGSSSQLAAQAKRETPAKPSYPPTIPGTTVETYKTIGAGKEAVELKLWIFAPSGDAVQGAKTPTPAIVFFFGGGWSSGSPAQFERHAKHFAARGMTAIVADYRVASRQKAKPAECVADAKSCIRWVRAQAAKLNIDPDRIVAAGGSAGGHLAAATATLPKLDEAGEDADVSSMPNALVLFNPCVVTAPFPGIKPEGFASDLTAARAGAPPQDLSPIHHVKAGIVPTLIVHGKADTTVPYATVAAFAAEMKKNGNRCDLIGYDGQPHGFFNKAKFDETLQAADDFLTSLKYIPPQAKP